jgi:hypothetical protein
VQIYLDSGAIRFKFHDWVRQQPIDFQNTTLGLWKAMNISMHYDDLQGCAHLAISALDWCKELTSDRTHGQQINAYKMQGLPIVVP